MNLKEVEFQSNSYKKALPYYLTIQITILIVTILQLSSTIAAYRQMGFQPIDGWIALWFVLEIFGISIMMILWFIKQWKSMPKELKINLTFGYFAGVWVGFVSLIYHYPIAPLYSLITAGLGIVWLVMFVLLRKKKDRPEEIFP
jgi:hypothetical protein